MLLTEAITGEELACRGWADRTEKFALFNEVQQPARFLLSRICEFHPP
jgi:hypothetical protein